MLGQVVQQIRHLMAVKIFCGCPRSEDVDVDIFLITARAIIWKTFSMISHKISSTYQHQSQNSVRNRTQSVTKRLKHDLELKIFKDLHKNCRCSCNHENISQHVNTLLVHRMGLISLKQVLLHIKCWELPIYDPNIDITLLRSDFGCKEDGKEGRFNLKRGVRNLTGTSWSVQVWTTSRQKNRKHLRVEHHHNLQCVIQSLSPLWQYHWESNPQT